jgi:hypothetical protein
LPLEITTFAAGTASSSKVRSITRLATRENEALARFAAIADAISTPRKATDAGF